MLERKYNSREGFSLIEVIVAVAILAVLSLPILIYFTDSAIHTANGRHEQAAAIAAQTVVEEIDSVNNFENIEDHLKLNDNGWTIKDEDKATALSGEHAYSLLGRPVIVDGNRYYANVKIDYNPYTAVEEGVTEPGAPTPSPTPYSQFNRYKTPHFQELYSDESVVISEKKDCFDVALNNLYYTLNGSAFGEVSSSSEKVSMDVIKAKIKRQFNLSILEYPTKFYNVKGWYHFTVDTSINGTAVHAETDAVLCNKRTDATKLKNVYFIFMPRYGGDEAPGTVATQDVVVDLPTSTGNGITPVSDMSINFIRQNFPGSITEGYTQDQLDAMNSMNFNLCFDPGKCSSTFLTAHYYSDIEYGSDGAILTTGPYVALQNTRPSVGKDPNMSRGLINRAQTKRIAAVTVQVFRADDTTGEPTGTVLATSTTTKTV